MSNQNARKQWIQKSWEVNADSTDADSFGLVYSGVISVAQDGVYSFYLTADDGAVLKIAGRSRGDITSICRCRNRVKKVAKKFRPRGLNELAKVFSS